MAMLQLWLVVMLYLDGVSSSVNVALPEGNNYAIGQTLDSLFKVKASPFSAETFAQLENVYEAEEQGGPDARGSFKMVSEVVSTQDEKLKALGIDASIDVSYMKFSADAHMKFASKNVDSASDVSVVVRASAGGKTWKLAPSALDQLELDPNFEIPATFEDFTEMYGNYMIVGFEYGGEILFQCTKTAKSTEDKKSIEAGLTASFSGPSTEVKGSMNMSVANENIHKSVNSHQEYIIRPNVANNEIIGNLIGELKKLAAGKSSNGMDPNFEPLAQSFLSEHSDKIKAILVPLNSVKAVHAAYVNPNAAGSPAFVRFLNEMYMAVTACQRELDMVEKQWKLKKTGEESVLDDRLIGTWRNRLTRYENELMDLNTAKLVLAESLIWNDNVPFDTDVMSAESFMDIPVDALRSQFRVNVMEPYREFMGPPTDAPTPSPTTAPTFSYRYIGGPKAMSWNEANNWCRSEHDVPLATIRDGKDNADATAACTAEDGRLGKNCWIGLKRDEGWGKSWKEKYEKWASGEKGSQNKFRNWAPGEPNNMWGREACASLGRDGWNDNPCGYKTNPVCGPIGSNAAAKAADEQKVLPSIERPPALIALHSQYCCQANTVDGWNGNWNGVCWGYETEEQCNDNGRKCQWTPGDCRTELSCLLINEECTYDKDCCSGRCKVDDGLCR